MGIEPTYKSFADSRLTTWLSGLICLDVSFLKALFAGVTLKTFRV